MKSFYCLLIGSVFSPTLSAAIPINGPSSTAWVSLGANYDFLGDQQTGSASSDIVGTASNPGFFTTFDGGGTPSLTDGFLGFRIRLDAAGGTNSSIKFDRYLWLGIDADQSGSVDVFLGLNMQGNSNSISIFDTGTGTNLSPNTTSISNSPAFSYTPSTANYSYRAVNYLTDGGTTNDNTPLTTGDPDYYVSFAVPFADVVSFLNSKSIVINENSGLRYVVATSTQGNSLNQDLGGVNGGINSTTSWEALGGFSPNISAGGQIIPEASSTVLITIGGLLACSYRRRK